MTKAKSSSIMVRRDVRNVSTNDSQILSSCPFCGGEAETREIGFPYHYWDVWCDGECFEHFCEKATEAEAIAAWNTRAELGSTCPFARPTDLTDGCAALERIAELEAELGSGMLTAEQVRTAIFNGSSYASYDGAKYYADGINMQAIADELNAELVGGTCEMVTSGTACKGNTDKRCTACGAYGIGEHYDGDEHIATPKFCPECGAKVVSE